MLWIWKHYHLTAVVCIIFVMHLAEPYELDQDVVITRVTETSIAIMSWGYTGIPPSAFYNRRIERKKMDSFEVVLNHFPLNGKNDLYGVFENKTVLFNETADNVTVTVYDFEQQFHGEYRLSVDQSIGPPAISGLTVFYLCLVPKTANLTGPDSQTLGTNINMTCAVESNSLGEEYRKNVTRIYYWEVNNNPVVAGDDYEFNNNIEENSVNSSLIIKNIRAEMNGNNYTCFAVEDGCEIDSPKSSPYMLQAGPYTSSVTPDDTSVSTDTPSTTEDPSVTQPSSSPTLTSSDDPTPAPKSGWSHWYILLIALGCLVILVVIAVVIHRRTQRKDNDLDPVTELKPPSVHAAPADHGHANTAGYRPSQHQQPRREDNTA